MVDFTQGSTVNRFVTGGTFGDFKWPYNVPDGAFGPWSPLCKSELLDPTAPCRPYIDGQPCNFKELTFMFSEVLQAVVTLCHDVPPTGSPGDPEWVDPRLVAIDTFLDFHWGNCFNDLSEYLQKGISFYLVVILREATLRQNYVYFTKYPELQVALKSIHDNFDGCSWGILEDRLHDVAKIILGNLKNKDLMSYQLNIQISNVLDLNWLKENNETLKVKKDYSLTIATNIVSQNLTLTETLKRYCTTDGVLQFELTQCRASQNTNYNMKYGNSKFSVRTNVDFLNVAKAVFGT